MSARLKDLLRLVAAALVLPFLLLGLWLVRRRPLAARVQDPAVQRATLARLGPVDHLPHTRHADALSSAPAYHPNRRGAGDSPRESLASLPR